MPTDYGSDVSTYQDPNTGVADLDPNFTIIRGPRVVIERIARKLITPGKFVDKHIAVLRRKASRR